MVVVPCCVCATRGLAASRGAYAKLGFGRLERETADEDLAQLNRRLSWWCLLFRSNSLCAGRCGHCHGLAAAALLHVVARRLASRRVVGHHAPMTRNSAPLGCLLQSRQNLRKNPKTGRAHYDFVLRSAENMLHVIALHKGSVKYSTKEARECGAEGTPPLRANWWFWIHPHQGVTSPREFNFILGQS